MNKSLRYAGFDNVTPEEFVSAFKTTDDFAKYLKIAVYTPEDLAEVMAYCVEVEKYDFCAVIRDHLT